MKREHINTIALLFAVACLIWLCLEVRSTRKSNSEGLTVLSDDLANLRHLRPVADACAKLVAPAEPSVLLRRNMAGLTALPYAKA